jgi:hypothetical protein
MSFFSIFTSSMVLAYVISGENMKKILTIIFVLGASSLTQAASVKVKASIDGRSQLIVRSVNVADEEAFGDKGVSLVWNHLLWKAPEDIQVGEKDWSPTWPATEGEVRTYFPFGKYKNLISSELKTSLPRFNSVSAGDYKVKVLSGRSNVRISEYPSEIPYIHPSATYFIIDIDDPEAGSDSIEFEITYPEVK